MNCECGRKGILSIKLDTVERVKVGMVALSFIHTHPLQGGSDGSSSERWLEVGEGDRKPHMGSGLCHFSMSDNPKRRVVADGWSLWKSHPAVEQHLHPGSGDLPVLILNFNLEFP